MNSLRNAESEEVEDMHGRRDREITLGTTLVLGIFFALAVLCAVFFAFGYSAGRHSVVTSASAEPATNGPLFSGLKPSPGNPVGSSALQPSTPTVTLPYTPPPASSALPVTRTAAQSTVAEKPSDSFDADAAIVTASTPPPKASIQAPPLAPSTFSAVPTGSGSMVQVAAVSHQEDADLLVSTLKRRGYNVAIHQEPADKLLHVQIGPFSNRKDADAMRQRLLGDGFNAYVK